MRDEVEEARIRYRDALDILERGRAGASPEWLAAATAWAHRCRQELETVQLGGARRRRLS